MRLWPSCSLSRLNPLKLTNAVQEERMGKPVKVNGLLSMRIDLIDRSGASVGTLASTTPEPTVVIYIENISGGPRSVEFVNILQNGANWMEFTGPGVSADRWKKGIDNIPDRKIRERRCSLSHKAGPKKNEPI